MLEDSLWTQLIPVFAFLGCVGLGLAINRILPASTGPYLPKRWLFGLVGIVILLMVVLFAVHIWNTA